MSPTPPAAWYPDPSGVAELRYWDGAAWTPGVVIAGEVTERPMPWPPAVEYKPADDRLAFPGRAALYGLGGFVAGLAAGVLLAVVADLVGLPGIVALALNLAGLWTGLLGACWLASRRYGSGQPFRDFGLRLRAPDLGWGVLMSILARLAGAVALIPFLSYSRRLVGDNQGVYGEVTDSPAAFAIFAVIAVCGAPIVEELFFRGLLLRSLTSLLGTRGAIVTQAGLFGLAHFSPLLGLANLSVMAVIAAAGIVFGITAERRGVGTSAVAHAAFNLVSVVVAAFVLY